MKGTRVGIVGAGNVGATVAYSLAMKGVSHEIILRDNKVDRAKGMALDMSQAANAARQHTVVSVAEDMSQLTDCDVIVITAGSPRLPGMSRDDLLMVNANIMKEVVSDIKKYSPNAILVPVSNPLDAMVYTAIRETGWERNRVVGMAGILDSARMAHFIYEKVGYGAGQIRASVMGGHGDDMVPLPRFSTIAGVPLIDLLTEEEIEEIVEKTRHGGAEIVSYLKTGSAYYAPAKSTAIMVEAILKDTKQIFPCAVMLEGEYGYSDVVTGVPVALGARGVEKIIEISLNEKQEAQFKKSVDSVRKLIDTLNNNNFFGDQ
ncbi:MAG TPA: malate dehydrogenase [Campylobacteraceae bacterium]|nr:malate dehydrogenase [Campylobacteraceae bacterium]HHD83462.1 malate dehydrogenase [Campylobacteraceae bacterium]